MRQKLKTALALVGLCVVVIVSVDLIGRVAAAFDERYFGPPDNLLLADDDLRAALPAYSGFDYDPRELLEEVRKSDRAVYEPYTIWKRRPYRGTYTTIDITGARRTVGNSPARTPLKYGCSAVPQSGASARPTRDHTQPPAALLNGTLGIESNVRNLGRRGFVSTQEVIYLMRELQAGRRPDVVVFYNGVNDAAAVSLWPEFPGRSRIVRYCPRPIRVNGRECRYRLVRPLDRTLQSIENRPRSSGRRPFERDGIIVYSDRDTDSRPNYRWLAERGIDLWLFNARVIDGLARAYGFTPLMAFQPGLWSTGKPLDPSEESLIASEMEYARAKYPHDRPRRNGSTPR